MNGKKLLSQIGCAIATAERVTEMTHTEEYVWEYKEKVKIKCVIMIMRTPSLSLFSTQFQAPQIAFDWKKSVNSDIITLLIYNQTQWLSLADGLPYP